jgi:hypothetical protein
LFRGQRRQPMAARDFTCRFLVVFGVAFAV